MLGQRPLVVAGRRKGKLISDAALDDTYTRGLAEMSETSSTWALLLQVSH